MRDRFSSLHMLTSKLHSLLFRIESLMGPHFLQSTEEESHSEPTENIWGGKVSQAEDSDTRRLVDKHAQKSKDDIETLLTALKTRDKHVYKNTGFFCLCPIRPKNAVILYDDMNIERHAILINLGPPLTIEIAIHAPEEEDFEVGWFKQISGISSIRLFKQMLFSLHLNSEDLIPRENVQYGDYIQNDPSMDEKIKDVNMKYLIRWLNANFGNKQASNTESRDKYIHDMFDISEATFTYIEDQKWEFQFHSVEYQTFDHLILENDLVNKYLTLTTYSQYIHPKSDQRTHRMKFTNIHSVGKMVHLMRSRQYWNASYDALKPYPGSEAL